jgi:L-rhamnonate dehydratase
MSASSRRLSAIYRQCDPARDGRPPRPPPPSSSVAASGCRQPPVIKQVVAQILRLPEVDGSKGDSGQDTLLVRIVTECGLVGFGEVEAQPEVAKAIIDAPRSWGGKKIGASGLRVELVGENALDHERLWNKMYAASSFYGRHAVVIQAMAGVDMALWDLKGKFLQLPLYQLLGGRAHDRLRAYASTLFGDTPEETAARGRALTERGYTAVKFGWGPMGESAEQDEALVAAARAGVGPSVSLLVDAACVWPDARTALARARAFEKYDLFLLEEPLHPDDMQGYRWLRDRSPIPIAAGENESGRHEFAPWIDQRALDYYQVDLGKCGVTDAVAIRKRVEDRGGAIINHCYKTPISIACCLHWLCTAPSAVIFEDCVEESPLRNELTVERIQAGPDGWIGPPEGPGLGITVNESTVSRLLVAESGW